MEVEHIKAKDQCRITSSMLHMVSKDNNRSLLSFMGKNKRMLNIHEQNFAEITSFQANTNVFHVNINASLKNLETQVGQLALIIQNQS